MRESGRRLPVDDMRARRVIGRLTFTDRTRSGAPESRATVCSEDGRELLVSLRCAHLRKIDRGGLLLSGFLDEGRSVVPVRQAWWCVPCAKP